MTPQIPISQVTWNPCWRIVSSRFPPQGLFDRVTDPKDLETVMAIEKLTNDRLRQEVGEIALVPEKERITGAGTTPVMAAFTHPNPSGSRFADATYGVYYAGKSVATTVSETRYHRERFLRATDEPPIEVDVRSYASNIDAKFHDLRGQQDARPDLYGPDPTAYDSPQALGKSLRAQGSNGIAYNSVRNAGGECIAVFRANLLSPTRQGEHFCYVWDGNRISNVYNKTEYP
jgi:hypothetical protein